MMKTRRIIPVITIIILLYSITAAAQTNLIYQNLPVGKYAVGFKIFTIIDDSRITKPEYNYLGEKNENDRRRKITIHLVSCKTKHGKKDIGVWRLLLQRPAYKYK